MDWQDVCLRAMGAFHVSAEMRSSEVVALSVYSEKGAALPIRHPKSGEVMERSTSPVENIQII